MNHKFLVLLSFLGIILLLLVNKESLQVSEPTLAASPPLTIDLQEPAAEVKLDLLEALRIRKSTKSFQKQAITPQDLATLLWATGGVNRQNGKRTAPAAYGRYFMDIYIAADQGVYRYEPTKHQLIMVSNENIKAKTSKLPFVGTASHVFIFVANLKEFPFFVNKADRLTLAHATTGCMSENLYLAAAALNLGTCLVSTIDTKSVEEHLKLSQDQLPLYLMPVGYPK